MDTTSQLTTADALIEKIDQLHSAPQVVQKILHITRHADFNMNELVECLQNDPALAARLLRVVNSARYGLRHKVTSVRRAACYAGPRSIRLIALTFGLVDTLTRGVSAKLFAEYWRRALTMAVVASRLAPMHDDNLKDEAYACGLLADLGILALAQCHGEKYGSLCQSVAHGPELTAREREEFGCDHAFLGARLLGHWELPDPLVQAVRNHHHDCQDDDALRLAVHAGDLMADAIWTPNSPNLQVAKSLLEDKYGLDTDAFIDLALNCRPEITDGAAEFGVTIEGSIDCDQLVKEAQKRCVDSSLCTALELDSLTAAYDDASS